MQTLRTELIETQKVRADLMKWKLLIVAGIGGAALGFSGGSGSTSHSSQLALAVIPLACVYVDLLCRHLSLRNKAIGLYIANGEHDDKTLRDYERFYVEVSAKAWAGISLESIALVGCTVFLSIAIVPVGILASGLTLTPGPHWWPAALFLVSGSCGVVFSWALHRRYAAAKDRAESLAENFNGRNRLSVRRLTLRSTPTRYGWLRQPPRAGELKR